MSQLKIIQKKCYYCYHLGHTNEEHECQICFQKGHSELDVHCGICKSNKHIASEHPCQLCSGKGHKIIKFCLVKKEEFYCSGGQDDDHSKHDPTKVLIRCDKFPGIFYCCNCGSLEHDSDDNGNRRYTVYHCITPDPERSCKFCPRKWHNSEDHVCELCGGKNHNVQFTEEKRPYCQEFPKEFIYCNSCKNGEYHFEHYPRFEEDKVELNSIITDNVNSPNAITELIIQYIII